MLIVALSNFSFVAHHMRAWHLSCLLKQTRTMEEILNGLACNVVGAREYSTMMNHMRLKMVSRPKLKLLMCFQTIATLLTVNSISDIETVNNVGCGNRLHINFPPRVPPKRPSDDFAEHRQGLSIWKYQDQILSSLVNHRVTVIIGQAGSGKSTQVNRLITS